MAFSLQNVPMTNGLVSRLIRSLALKTALALVCAFCLTNHASADVKSDIGYARLPGDTTVGFTHLVDTLNQLGIAIPKGAGVPISLVEATQVIKDEFGTVIVRSYKPDPNNLEFRASRDPLLQPVVFTDGSNSTCQGGPCIDYSVHAKGQGAQMFGNTAGVAPLANAVTLYEANHFLTSVLNAPSGVNPESQPFRVQNFSWVGTFDDSPDTPPTAQQIADDVSALRRFDFLINRDNVTAVVGLNNNTDPLPSLLGQSYNAIAVGRTIGAHSSGLTNLANYGPGRSKPDMVSPLPTVSAATANVSSVATMLHGIVAGTDAAKSQTMKAMLMAGATKNEFTGWSRTTTQPLDDTFGAGEVNAFNSYKMTLAGRYAGSTAPVDPVGQFGWDYQTINPGSENELKYNFVIPAGSTAPELSILLTWNVNVISGFSGQTLTNLDLKLTDSLGQIVDQSLSTVDNVEHIYIGAGQGVNHLDPGTYTLTISTDAPKDFGLAWRMSTDADVDSSDFDGDGDVDGRDLLTWQRGFGTIINATRSMGDADGDGDVDRADLQFFHAQYTIPEIEPPLLAYAVPEPSAAALLAGGFLAFLGRRVSRKPWAPKPCFG
jgi:hypothetical protein